MPKVTMIDMGSPEDLSSEKSAVESSIEEGSNREDEGFTSLLQGVSISPKPLMGLISSLNKVLPLFGLPPIKDSALTPEVIRSLSMISQASSDACAEEECPMDLTFTLDDLKGGDSAVLVVAGKLDRISKTPSFKKFLKGKPSSPSEQPPMGDKVAMEKTSEQSPDIEKLFSSRM